MRFTTTVLRGGRTATGFVVPPEVAEALNSGKKPAARVTARDTGDVDVELDTQSRGAKTEATRERRIAAVQAE